MSSSRDVKANPEWRKMTEIQRGALLFQIKCQRCHANSEKDNYRRGPNLWGVVGRYAGLQGYKKYSEELKQSGLFWTRKNLKKYMHDPKKTVPGTYMFYGAELRAQVQADCVVSYLESISPGYQQRISKYKADKKVEDSNNNDINRACVTASRGGECPNGNVRSPQQSGSGSGSTGNSEVINCISDQESYWNGVKTVWFNLFPPN
mmetsp:Transcript_13585/g.12186  ORF Transcript_13585/g.12186 Transcript_13585/m.12186 type:complete len:205 (-) Transcript_13585:107-721(-)